MLKDELLLYSQIILIKRDKQGRILEAITTPPVDIVTTVGKEKAASHLANTSISTTWFSKIALGTNNDTESTEDLALGNEIYSVDLDDVWASGCAVFGRWNITASDIGSDSYSIYELGLKNGDDDLIARQVLNSSFDFSGLQQMDANWKVTVI